MFKRIQPLFHRGRFESDLDAELRDHMQKYRDDLVSQGVHAQEAELRARREFGRVTAVKEEVRESSGLAWIDTISRNFRYAFRVLRKNPTFALTVILTLALCIGANTAIFSVVDAVLFRPLPYPESDRLAEVTMLIRSPEGEFEQTAVNGATWEFLREQVRTLDLAVRSGGSEGANLSLSGASAGYVQQQRVSARFFQVLGVAPFLGREFTPEEDRVGGPAVVVLSHRLWTRLFASDPGMIGSKIFLRGEPYTVVGIMPAGFDTAPSAELWTPLRPSIQGEGSGTNYDVIARIRPEYQRHQADAELASLAEAYYRAYNVHFRKGVSAQLHLLPVLRALGDSVRTPLLLLWAAVGLVLLIGCVNVAGLILARGGARRHEIATRLALGSGRRGIVGQLLAESCLLAIAGGLGGLALGSGALQGLRLITADTLHLAQPAAIDGRVLAMTAATALLTSLLFGLYPAMDATRMDIRTSLVSSTRTMSARSGWIRRGLVVCEVALGMVLLVTAGLVLRTLSYLTNLNPGFDGRNVLTASLSLQDARYATAASGNRLFDMSLERIRQGPGVEAAGVGLTLPYERALNVGVQILDGPHAMTEPQTTNLTYITPGYFEALRFTLLRGRRFTDADRDTARPIAIVNEAYARRFFREDDPLGRHLTKNREIVGIVADVQQARAGWGDFGPVGPIPNVYVPAAQMDDSSFQLVHTWFSPKWVVRAAGPQPDGPAIIRRAVASVDPQLPFAEFRTMTEVRSRAFAFQRLNTLLLGGLAVLALTLATIGIYGLIANSVAERTREISIRLALGASIKQAIAGAASSGIVLAASGIVLGAAMAFSVRNLVRALIYGVQATDLETFATVGSVLLIVAVLASLLPSLRIARLDPATTLREE